MTQVRAAESRLAVRKRRSKKKAAAEPQPETEAFIRRLMVSESRYETLLANPTGRRLVRYMIADILPAAFFLKQELSLTLDDMSVSVLKYPHVLCGDVAVMRAAVQWLQSLGLDRAAVGKVVVARPNILRLNINSLLSKAKLFKAFGMTLEQISAVISRCPRILELSVDGNLRPKLRLLLTHYEKDPVLQRFIEFPQFMGYSLERMEKRVEIHLRQGEKGIETLVHSIKLTEAAFEAQYGGGQPLEAERP